MANIFKAPCDEGVIRSRPCGTPCREQYEPWILTATIIASSMVLFDGTAVNVALPVLQAELGASVAEVQWIVESYGLFLAALLLVGGSLGDRFGRRRVFSIGTILFALASLWCGLAPETNQLIVARAVQGIGGALLTPGSLAIISASFPETKRGRAIGTWSAATAVGAALGPILGGWFVEHLSWRWIFFINVPLAVIVVAISSHCVPENRDDSAVGTLDWRGGLLATVGLGALVYGLVESATLGLTHPRIVVASFMGIFVLIAFVIVELRAPTPMLPFHLFRSRTFTGANLLTLFLYAALTGALFFLPFNLIQIQGYNATAAGAALLPFVLVLFLLSRWAGGFVDRYGARLLLIFGSALSAGGYVLLAIPGIGGTYWITVFPAMIVLGLGMAISIAPLTTTVMGAVDVRYTGIASGINNAIARTAGLLAIALMGVLVLLVFNAQLDNHLATLEVPRELKQIIDSERVNGAAAKIPAAVSAPLRTTLEDIFATSFLAGYRVAMLSAAALSLTSVVVAWTTIAQNQATRP